MNVDSGETTVISADVMTSSENITFDPAQLDTNSNYNVSVLASNVAGSAVSYTRISECCDYWVCVHSRCRNLGGEHSFQPSRDAMAWTVQEFEGVSRDPEIALFTYLSTVPI